MRVLPSVAALQRERPAIPAVPNRIRIPAGDGADLLTWQKWIGTTGTAATFARGDANGDRVINADDLAVWIAGFGQTPTFVGATGAVPEPSTAALVGSIIAAWVAARQRSRAK